MKDMFRGWPRDAWLVLAARTSAVAVNALLLVTLVLRIHDSGAGPIGNTGLMIAMAVPPVLTMSLAGRAADRYDSRTVLTVALGSQIAAAIALAAADQLYWTYGWAFVMQTGSAFSNPVWLALVPRIVGEDRVQGLAGAQMLLSSLASPLGAAGAGVLVGMYGNRIPPAIAAGLLLFTLLMAVAIRTHRHGHTETATDDGTKPDNSGGLRVILRDPVLGSIFLGALVVVVVVQGVNVVEVFLARDQLHATPAEYGLSELFFAGGSLAASLVVAKMTNDHRRILGVVGGFGATGLVCIAIGLAPNFPAYLALVVALGLVNAAANGGIGPLFILRSADAARGRVIATLSGSFAAAGVISLAIGGLVGAWLGPRATFTWGGLLSLAVVLVMAAIIESALEGPTSPDDQDTSTRPLIRHLDPTSTPRAPLATGSYARHLW